MDKKRIKSLIHEYLSQQHEVVFAYLFGSFAGGETYRDIDVAIYTENQIELIRIGTMQTELSQQLPGHEVDLVHLNRLPDQNPALAYNIVTGGELLINSEQQKHIEFKKKTLLYYFDTAWLRRSVDEAFKQRLESNRFGQRDYV